MSLFQIINTIVFIILICCSIFFLYKMNSLNNIKKNYQIIFDKLLQTTYPICLINLSTNKIDMVNENFSKIFNKNINELNNNDAFNLEIFKDYNTYLKLKNECLNNSNGNIILKNEFNNKNHIYNINYSLVKFGFKKYMVISVDDKTNLVEYIKKLGLFTKIADDNKEGIIVVNFSRDVPIISYVNNSIGDITGYSINEVINKPLAVLFETNVNEETLNNLYNNLKNKTETILEYQYFKKDGSICWIRTNMVPIIKQSVIDRLIELNNNEISNIDSILDITDFDIYITLYQTDITDHKLNYEIPTKAYMNKITEYNKSIDKFFNIVDNLLNMPLMIDKNNIYRQEILKQITSIVGQASDSDKCYIYKIIDDKMKLQYIWRSEEFEDRNYNLIEGLTFEEAGMFKLYSNLIMNKPLYYNIDTIKENIYTEELFNMNNIKCSLVYPIMKDNELIGFIGINSNEENKKWNDNINKLMKMVSEKLSNII